MIAVLTPPPWPLTWIPVFKLQLKPELFMVTFACACINNAPSEDELVGPELIIRIFSISTPILPGLTVNANPVLEELAAKSIKVRLFNVTLFASIVPKTEVPVPLHIVLLYPAPVTVRFAIFILTINDELCT